MTIDNEEELESAYVAIGKVICDCNATLADNRLTPSLRESVAEGIEARRRKIAREIADYHTRVRAETEATAPATIK